MLGTRLAKCHFAGERTEGEPQVQPLLGAPVYLPPPGCKLPSWDALEMGMLYPEGLERPGFDPVMSLQPYKLTPGGRLLPTPP